MKYLTIIILVIVLLSGCSLFQKREDSKPVVVEYRTASIPVFHPPLPSRVQLVQPKFKVWTPKLLKEYLKDLEAGKAPQMVIYGLTKDGYEDLGNDMAELKRALKGFREIIIYYRKNVNEMAAPIQEKPVSELPSN